MLADLKDSDASKLELPDFPGRAEAFELAAKFCYGFNFQIDSRNAASLMCAAAYLDMSEVYAVENLSARTEAYLTEVVLGDLSSCVLVLQSCESLLPMAEELGIVSRCAEAIAAKTCQDQMTPTSLSYSDFSSSGRIDGYSASPSFTNTPKRKSVEWWAEELSILRVDMFQIVISAMKARGLRSDTVATAIVHYAQRWLTGISRKQSGILESKNRTRDSVRDSATTREHHEQQILVETLVSLLPAERNIISVTFLFALLRTAIYLDTTIACRLDLERRIGWQLEQSSIDDLLIPSYSSNATTLFDLDTVQRIVMNFLQQESDRVEDQYVPPLHDYDSPSQSSVMKTARLLDCYLAEVAPDPNLNVATFIGTAELMPGYSRVVDDGLYRAIDIYLKAHPRLNELERKKVCGLMDCRKLSQEACKHAAQNERLPVHVVVQVLYFEQMRLKKTVTEEEEEAAAAATSQARMMMLSPREDYVAVRRENRELKTEMAKIRSKLGEKENQLPPLPPKAGATDHQVQGYIKKDGEKSKSRFFQSFSKKLGKLNPFQRASSSNDNALKIPGTPDIRTSRRRRHSMS